VSDGQNCTTTWCDTIRIDTLPPLPCDASFGYNAGFFTRGVDFYLINPIFVGNPNVFWDFGDGNTGTGPWVNHIYAQPDTYTVCAFLTDPITGCADTSCQSVIVTNQWGQNCSAFFFNNHDPNDPNLVHFFPLDSNLVSYAWDFGDGTTSTSNVPTHRYNASGTYTVCLTVSDGNQCVDSFCTQILVGPVGGPCLADFTAIPDTNGSTVQFSALFPDPNIFYSWDFGDGNTGTGPSITHTYAATGAYTVILTITDSINCNNRAVQIISTTPQSPTNNLLFGQVMVNGVPALDVTVYLIEYDSIAGTLTAIDTFVSDPSLGFSGIFFFNAPAGDFLLKAALSPTDPDFANYLPTYYGDVLTWDSAMMVNAAQFPLAFVNLQAGANTGGPGFIGGLISQGAGKNGEGDPMEGMSVMVMDQNGMPITHSISHEDGTYEITGLAYGTYHVIVEFWGKTSQYHTITLSPSSPSATNVNFAVNEDFIEAVSPSTSISDILDLASMRLFPNPTQGQTNLELDLRAASPLELTISDLSGKRISLQQIEAPAGRQRIELNTEQIPQGIYFLNISADGEFSYSTKLIKN
jgi:PKD repeat protein